MSAGFFRYHMEVRGRSNNRNAVRGVAYITGKSYYDEKEKRSWALGDESRVAHTEVSIPEKSPEWLKSISRDNDHAKLWNAVEAKEKRKDAQLWRDLGMGLDDNLIAYNGDGEIDRPATVKLQAELLRAHLEKHYISKGMSASWAIHWGQGPNDKPHAHVMLTMRDAEEKGFGKKNRSWNDQKKADDIKKDWADRQNKKLEELGIAYRTDHRSNKRRGIDIEPEEKHYNNPNRIAERDVKKKRRNVELMQKTKPVLDLLGQCFQKTFTDRDLDLISARYASNDNDQKRLKVELQKSLLLTADRYGTFKYKRPFRRPDQGKEKASPADRAAEARKKGYVYGKRRNAPQEITDLLTERNTSHKVYRERMFKEGYIDNAALEARTFYEQRIVDHEEYSKWAKSNPQEAAIIEENLKAQQRAAEKAKKRERAQGFDLERDPDL